MSKRTVATNNFRNEKYKEFVEKYCDENGIEDAKAIRIAFNTGFNIGYTRSRNLIRDRIDNTHIYDRCVACDCLTLVDREIGLCVDCIPTFWSHRRIEAKLVHL